MAFGVVRRLRGLWKQNIYKVPGGHTPKMRLEVIDRLGSLVSLIYFSFYINLLVVLRVRYVSGVRILTVFLVNQILFKVRF